MNIGNTVDAIGPAPGIIFPATSGGRAQTFGNGPRAGFNAASARNNGLGGQSLPRAGVFRGATGRMNPAGSVPNGNVSTRGR